MKVMEFKNFDEFEQCENKQDYEMVAIVHYAERNTVCADLMTDCKSWKTAVKRFFKALENRPEFSGWKESIIESCENGYFSDKETYWDNEKGSVYTGGYFWEVEDHGGSFYVCLNVVE